MRADGLTTAKMLAIARHLCFNRRIRLKHDEQDKADELSREIEEFKKDIKGGISKAEFITRMIELGYPQIEYAMSRKGSLEFYNEEHEYIFDDNSVEDQSGEEREEVILGEGKDDEEGSGFIGLRQIEAEKNAAE
jgi:hypothetical protein